MVSRKIIPRWGYMLHPGPVIQKPGRCQRTELLLTAVAKARSAEPYRVRGVALHCQGGRAYDRHARRLVREGFLKMTRHAFGRSCRSTNYITWSVLVPTAKGFAEADRISRV